MLCIPKKSYTILRLHFLLALIFIALGSVPMQVAASFDPSYGWSSVSAIYRDAQSLVLANVNYEHGRQETLSRFPASNSQYFYGVSPDGQKIVYSQLQEKNIRYAFASRTFPQGKEVLNQSYRTGNSAIWLRDSRNLLVIDSNQGILQINVETGTHLQKINAPFDGERFQKLFFVHNNYIYAEGAVKYPNALVRIALDQPTRVEALTPSQPDAQYWLTPEGDSILYRSTAAEDKNALFTISTSDGARSLFREAAIQAREDWHPIGFGETSTWIVMRKILNHLQILEVFPFSDRPPTILCDDAAPGAVNLGTRDARAPMQLAGNVALAPYGHAVMVQGTMADGSSKIWSTNLRTNQQISLDLGSSAYLLGWNKMPVP